MTDKRKKINWLAWVRDLGLVFLLVILIQWWQTRDIAVGPAPDLTGDLLSGQSVALDDFAGQPVLVHFWATWCPICRTEDGSIDNLAEDYPVLTVATNSGGAGEVRKYLQDNGLDFPVILDESGTIGGAWGIKGVPSSFIIDGRGEIRSVAIGYTTELGLRFRLWMADS